MKKKKKKKKMAVEEKKKKAKNTMKENSCIWHCSFSEKKKRHST